MCHRSSHLIDLNGQTDKHRNFAIIKCLLLVQKNLRNSNQKNDFFIPASYGGMLRCWFLIVSNFSGVWPKSFLYIYGTITTPFPHLKIVCSFHHVDTSMFTLYDVSGHCWQTIEIPCIIIFLVSNIWYY